LLVSKRKKKLSLLSGKEMGPNFNKTEGDKGKPRRGRKLRRRVVPVGNILEGGCKNELERAIHLFRNR